MKKNKLSILSGIGKHLTAVKAVKRDKYVLHLYVAGQTLRSMNAVHNIKNICHDYLPGRCHIKVIDLYRDPFLAAREQIIATPTLIKMKPLPKRMLVGNLTNIDAVFAGLDLRP